MRKSILRTLPKAQVVAIGALALLTAAACSPAPPAEAPVSRIPAAFDGYDISDLDMFLGGAWVYVSSVKDDCGLGGDQTCAHLKVANDPACAEGFYANVQFRDEYGDVLDTVRERALGVNADTLTNLDVPTSTAGSVARVTIESAACI